MYPLKEKINVVWFKKDLRYFDHEPLKNAEINGLPCLLLYIFEPEVINHPTSDLRHFRFIYESLADINQCLTTYYHRVNILHGNATEIFQLLIEKYHVENVFSHIETGIKITYERDLSLQKLFLQHQVNWIESQNGAVIRKLGNRKLWSEKWNQVMHMPIIENNLKKLNTIELDKSLFFHYLNIPEIYKTYHPNFQKGGTTFGIRYLNSFLETRGRNYSKNISKPLDSRTSCSRLSPYISYGNLSMKFVYQKTLQEKQNHPEKKFSAFISRLHWHCHFIQKFESECRIEFENFNKAFDVIRNDVNELFFEHWKNGTTGIPIVDACMRCVQQTGYLNFRMRAMVVSFYTVNLFQPWQKAAEWLAKMFLDFEPGIHFPQIQMQACTTATNTMRIYNPYINSLKHDPEGIFIKKWIPELRFVPIELIHQPYLMDFETQKKSECIIGIDYPFPIVDIKETSKKAKNKISKIYKSEEGLIEASKIIARHVKSKARKQNERSEKRKSSSKKMSDLQQKLFVEEEMGKKLG